MNLINYLKLYQYKNSTRFFRKSLKNLFRTLGSGKITYLKSIFDKKVKLLLIDFVLSAVQQRNLEQELNIKILDRTD